MNRGKLVHTSFDRVVRVGGIPRVQKEVGWAFIPAQLSTNEQIVPVLVELMAKHEQAAALLGRLDGRFQDNPGGFNFNPWVLCRPLRLREARLSSKIENTIASASEIEAVEVIEPERSEPREVRNYIRTVEMGSGDKGPITETKIRALHAILLEGIPDADKNYPGMYRSTQVMIGDEDKPFSEARFVPPSATEVSLLMQDLVGFIKEPPAGMTTLVAAALAHYQFETIHPFADGNGRLGRMLITLGLCNGTVLSRPLIYPSGYINQNKELYYDKLLRVSAHGDWKGWIEYFLDTIISEAKGTVERVQRLFQLRENYHRRFVDKKKMWIDFYNIIDYLFERSVITVNAAEDRIAGGNQTARNYIELLVERGVLKYWTTRGLEKYYVATEILQVVDED